MSRVFPYALRKRKLAHVAASEYDSVKYCLTCRAMPSVASFMVWLKASALRGSVSRRCDVDFRVVLPDGRAVDL